MKRLAIVTGALLALLLVGGMALSALDLSNTKLVYAEGDRPYLHHERSGGNRSMPQDIRHHTWDVRDTMETTFRVAESSVPSPGYANGVAGTLTISVPAACTDRVIHWRISVNGAQVAEGTSRWLREYRAETNHSSDGTLRTVTISADWNGGTDDCASFSMDWKVLPLGRALF